MYQPTFFYSDINKTPKIGDVIDYSRYYHSFFEVVDGDFGVHLGGLQGLVAEHLLDMTDGGFVFEHVGSAGVTQAVGADVLVNTGKMDAAFNNGPYADGIHFLAPTVEDQIVGVVAI